MVLKPHKHAWLAIYLLTTLYMNDISCLQVVFGVLLSYEIWLTKDPPIFKQCSIFSFSYDKLDPAVIVGNWLIARINCCNNPSVLGARWYSANETSAVRYWLGAEQSTRHYPSLRWPSSRMLYVVIRPQWVELLGSNDLSIPRAWSWF